MILIISTCKEKLSELEFVTPIERILGRCKTVHYSKLTQKEIDEADKIIISGTALADFDYLKHDWSWLTRFNKPIFGICAGMQAITKAFDIPLRKKETIGVHQVEVVKENKFCNGNFNAYFLHTLTGSDKFETLATSEGIPCLIKHPQKEIYGCIFHPEVMNENIIKSFGH
ncbi:hypothetical protein HY489_04325 [Candidatus Woesearchaeota archaeon]|nr:hypothetical protein [Candidatus Woesearchaeota archaeon]